MTLVTVVDASVALAWLLDESRPGWVDSLLKDLGRDSARFVVPSLFWLEIGNTLARYGSLSDDQALDAMLRIEALGMETIESDPPLRLRALQLARGTGLTMYDATYLALADSIDASVATLDRDLGAAARALGFDTRDVPTRISGKSEVYAVVRPSDPASLAAIGVMLARLRQRYAQA